MNVAEYQYNKQKIIVSQSSQRDAIEIVKIIYNKKMRERESISMEDILQNIENIRDRLIEGQLKGVEK